MLNRLVIYLCLVSLVNLGLSALCGGQVNVGVTVAPTEQPRLYKVRDAAVIGGWRVTVNGVTTPESDMVKPQPGQRFIVIDVTVENTSSETKPLSSLGQMQLKDASGQQYNIDVGAVTASGGTLPDAQLAAGEKVKGQVGFAVPVEASGLQFIFLADLIGGEKITVGLE
jgi:hypothetical protein